MIICLYFLALGCGRQDLKFCLILAFLWVKTNCKVSSVDTWFKPVLNNVFFLADCTIHDNIKSRELDWRVHREHCLKMSAPIPIWTTTGNGLGR